MDKVKLELAGMCVKPFAALLAEHEDSDAIDSLIDKFVQNVLLDGETNEHGEFDERLVFGYKIMVSGDNSFNYEFQTQTVADFIHNYAEETTSPRGIEKKYFYRNGKLCYWGYKGVILELREIDEDKFTRFMYDNALESAFIRCEGRFGLDFADIFKYAIDLEVEQILHA